MKTYWIIDSKFTDPSPILKIERKPDPDFDNELRPFVVGPKDRTDLINQRVKHFYKIWDNNNKQMKARFKTKKEAIKAYIAEALKIKTSLKKKINRLENNIKRLS